jgi:glycogen operon protein
VIALCGEGVPEPQGVRLLDESRANIAVFSAHATAIEFCVFAQDGTETRVTLPARTGDVWHSEARGLAAGMRYGLRAHGPCRPDQGHRFDAAKLLLDPFAAAVDRPFALHPALLPSACGDTAALVPKGIILAEAPPAAARTTLPWSRTFIYEVHVRGFSMRHPDIPAGLRGTFAALAHPAAIAHFHALGVTTLEVMPASAWIDERHLPPLGLSNYWGYNPVSYLAPDPRLAPGGWAEIQAATGALAAAGIEVLLDVVFNHSGEGDELGPTLSLRGLDNASYYRLCPDDPARYVNDTGCGNTLALDRPQGVRLAMDALRCWVRRGGVGGFRFDLATVLGRRADGFDPAAPLLAAITQDPELRGLKLIAEPWDVGPGGYQLGRFPPLWGEWNDRFRDGMRRFWSGRGTAGEMATRLAGSADVFAATRRPSRGINFITAHDGFTLADLVAYERKHNHANGEADRDGQDDNISWNNGEEGATARPDVLAARQADQRALLASLLLARGTPMLAMGSELGQTQGGNNNAYAQDNPTSWLAWEPPEAELAGMIGALWRLRAGHASLREDGWLRDPGDGGAGTNASWFSADGGPMSAERWQDQATATLVVRLCPPAPDPELLLIFHRGRTAATIVVPPPPPGAGWTLTFASAAWDRGVVGRAITVAPRSVLALTARAAVRPG